MLEILDAGVLTTLQDRGRIGYAHLGVPRAGALDPPAAALANRLVGNGPDAAVLEVTLGGLRALNDGPGQWAALAGARAPAALGPPVTRAIAHEAAFWWPAGTILVLGQPAIGVRTYLAISGGIDVAPVLGSRSTDTLAWVGPPRVRPGQRLPVGENGRPHPLDTPRSRGAGALRCMTGPQADWFADPAALTRAAWTVRPDSDRVGLRLDGPALERTRADELPSEGMVLGAIQVPPSGQPIVFLADHPPTGGYPVIGVVHPDDLWQCAQVRPGEQVRLAAAPTG